MNLFETLFASKINGGGGGGGNRNAKETYSGTLDLIGDDFIRSISARYGEFSPQRFYNDMADGNVSITLVTTFGGETLPLGMVPIEYDPSTLTTLLKGAFVLYTRDEEDYMLLYLASGFTLHLGIYDGDPRVTVDLSAITSEGVTMEINPTNIGYVLTICWHEMPEEEVPDTNPDEPIY